MIAFVYSAQRPRQYGLLVFLILFVYLFSLAGIYAQTIRYVKPSSAGSADGSSWANATSDLQGAINSLTATGGQVWVANGLYKPTTTSDPDSRTISFSMQNKVAIYGGFSGSESNLSDRVVSYPTSTTLSGNLGIEVLEVDNSYHVVVSLETDSTAVLDGFVITGGNANGTGNTAYGGGLFSSRSDFRLNNCYFVANSAVNGGAAFIGNSLSLSPGSFLIQTVSPRLTNCTFYNNTASIGGGVFTSSASNNNANPSLINCSFQSNRASNRAGGLYVASGAASPRISFINCSLQDNLAPSAGAIATGFSTGYNNYDISLVNCIVFGNGGGNTFYSELPTFIYARYSLFDQSVTNYNGDNTNQTTLSSPFALTSSTQLAMAPCSPAIDAGDPATTTATVGVSDLAGNPRLVRGRIDIGAYEYQGAICPLQNGYVYTLQTGRWDDAATWSVGRLPTETDQVLLKHSVTIPQAYVAHVQRLRFDSFGRLIYQTGGRLLSP